MRARFSSYRLPLLSGILLGSSYIPFPPWALLFSFVPLWLFWLLEGSIRKILWGGWVVQFVFCLVGFHWVAHTAHEFGHMSWPVALLVLLLFCAFGHLFLVLAGLTFALLRTRLGLSRAAQLALLPCITALCWRTVPMIFPWNLGYPWLGSRLPAFHLAEFVGFEGLGVLTLFLNVVLLAAWEDRKRLAGAYLLGGAAGLLLLLNGAGWIAGRSQPAPDATARVLIAQGNIGNLEKVSAETWEGVQEEILRRYFKLTLRGIAQAKGRPPDFAVWPESAFPGAIQAGRETAGYAVVLSEFVRRNGTPLITGALRHDAGTGRKSNSMVFIGRDGGMANRPYDKTHLLMFGEYLPFSAAVPGIRRWFPMTGDFTPGSGPEIRQIAGIRVGPQICYEGLFPDFSRTLAEEGAQIFVNVTNDSWFGTWAEPRQHLAMTIARGIEFRLPVVRATNTGISTAMTADGTVMERSPLQEEWAHLYEVPYRKEPDPTFYQRYGYRIIPAFLWLATAAVLSTEWLVKRIAR